MAHRLLAPVTSTITISCSSPSIFKQTLSPLKHPPWTPSRDYPEASLPFLPFSKVTSGFQVLNLMNSFCSSFCCYLKKRTLLITPYNALPLASVAQPAPGPPPPPFGLSVSSTGASSLKPHLNVSPPQASVQSFPSSHSRFFHWCQSPQILFPQPGKTLLHPHIHPRKKWY